MATAYERTPGTVDTLTAPAQPPSVPPQFSRSREQSEGMLATVKQMGDEEVARGLGWFSIGLGLAEVLAPNALADMIGAPRRSTLIRAMGLREIAAGLGIFSQRRPVAAMWSRVAGDALDLSLLGAALQSPRAQPEKLAVAAAAVLGVTVADVMCALSLSKPSNQDRKLAASDYSVRLKKSVTINRSREDIYQFWRKFENLPTFMHHLESVRVTGERSHWVAKGPAGTTVSWDAEILVDRPNELITWQSLPGSTISARGSVSFQPATGGRGTVVSVDIEYTPPAGAIGATVAKLFGRDPAFEVKEDLRALKQVLETGEVATTEGQSSGSPKMQSMLPM